MQGVPSSNLGVPTNFSIDSRAVVLPRMRRISGRALEWRRWHSTMESKLAREAQQALIADTRLMTPAERRFIYERRLFNRRLLLFAHVLVGLFAAFWYLSHIDFSHFQYWRRGAGLAVIFVSAPATLPYLVSAVYSWRVVTDHQFRVWVFLTVLVAGAVLVNLLVSGGLGIDAREVGMLQAAGLQTVAYVWAAEMLLHVV